MPKAAQKKTTRARKKKVTKLAFLFSLFNKIIRLSVNRRVAPTIIIFALSIWIYHSGEYQRWADAIDERQHAVTKSLGLTINNLVLDGQINTKKEDIIDLLNNPDVRDYSAIETKSIFNIDLWKTKEKLEKLAWVKHASVDRQYPSTLTVGIVEYTPVALWQDTKRRVQLIDESGHIIKEKNLQDFSNMIILVGEDVPTYAGSLLKMINSEYALKGKVSSATRISKRRWNINLFGNILVKLPEGDPEKAWKSLAKAQIETALLDSNIKNIDMRVKGKMFVQ